MIKKFNGSIMLLMTSLICGTAFAALSFLLQAPSSKRASFIRQQARQVL